MQTLVVVAVLCLTLRAMNRTVLAGTTGPAIEELAKWLSEGALRPLAQSTAVAPLAAALSTAVHTSTAGLASLGQQLAALDANARMLPLLRPVYAVAGCETYLAAPLRFLCRALYAFYNEVLLTGLRRLGFLTIQTLG